MLTNPSVNHLLVTFSPEITIDGLLLVLVTILVAISTILAARATNKLADSQIKPLLDAWPREVTKPLGIYVQSIGNGITYNGKVPCKLEGGGSQEYGFTRLPVLQVYEYPISGQPVIPYNNERTMTIEMSYEDINGKRYSKVRTFDISAFAQASVNQDSTLSELPTSIKASGDAEKSSDFEGVKTIIWAVVRFVVASLVFIALASIFWIYSLIPTFLALQSTLSQASALSFLNDLVIINGVLIGFVAIVANSNLERIGLLKANAQPHFSWKSHFRRIGSRLFLTAFDILIILTSLKAIIEGLVQITNAGSMVSSASLIWPMGWSYLVIILIITRIILELSMPEST